MVLCHRCGNNVCKPCAFTPAVQRKITVACNNMLSRPSHVQRLAVAARALELSRREFPNWMADVLFGFEGELNHYRPEVGRFVRSGYKPFLFGSK